MKNLILAALLVQSGLVFAREQEPVKYPAQLNCKEILNVFGTGELEDFVVELSDSEHVVQAKDDDLFIVDMSDGDQVTKYTFQRDDIGALNDGKVKSVRGTAWYGYWWADGDHVNNMNVIECTR